MLAKTCFQRDSERDIYKEKCGTITKRNQKMAWLKVGPGSRDPERRDPGTNEPGTLSKFKTGIVTPLRFKTGTPRPTLKV